MDDSTIAQISNDFLNDPYEILDIKNFMGSSNVKKICINRPGELYVENRTGWHRVVVPSLTFERAGQFCTNQYPAPPLSLTP